MVKNIRITWTQTSPDPNDIDHFEIGRNANGDIIYDTIDTIPYPGEQAEYIYDDTYDIPVNQSKTLYYVIRTYDADGNYSQSGVQTITLEMNPPPAAEITNIEIV